MNKAQLQEKLLEAQAELEEIKSGLATITIRDPFTFNSVSVSYDKRRCMEGVPDSRINEMVLAWATDFLVRIDREIPKGVYPHESYKA